MSSPIRLLVTVSEKLMLAGRVRSSTAVRSYSGPHHTKAVDRARKPRLSALGRKPARTEKEPEAEVNEETSF